MCRFLEERLRWYFVSQVVLLDNGVRVSSSIHRARRSRSAARRGSLVPRSVRALGPRTPASASGCGGGLEQRLAP